MLNLFLRSLKALVQNYRLTLPAIATAALFLLLVNVFVFVSSLSSKILENLGGKVTFTVTLKPDADYFQVQKLIASIEQLETVEKPVIFTSPGRAKSQIPQSLGLSENFGGSLPVPGTLKITPREPQFQKSIRAMIEGGPYRDLLLQNAPSSRAEGQAFEKVSAELSNLKHIINNMLFLLFFILTVSGIFMLFAVMKLQTHPRRTEMFIMKLVGASPKTLELPFFMEGAITAAAGWLIAVLLTLALPSFPFFPSDAFLVETFSSMPFTNIFLVELLVAVIVGVTASAILIWRLFGKQHHLLAA